MIAGRDASSGPLLSAEPNSDGLKKRVHFSLTPSEINLPAIQIKG